MEGRSTIVTTPLLPVEPRNDAGLREEGRSLWPEKRLEELLIAAEGGAKSVEREVRMEARIGVMVRDDEDGNTSIGFFTAKLKAVLAVATSMARMFHGLGVES